MNSVFVVVSISAVVASCFVYLAIGHYDSTRIRSVSEFLIYRRQLSTKQVFGTFYASGMSLATVFIAFMQFSTVLGTALIWSAIFYAGGHVLLWFLIPKILNQTQGVVTLHGFVGLQYDNENLKIIASIATTIGFIGVFATEIIVGSHLLGQLIGSSDSYWTAVAFLTVVALAYSLLGGFKSVVRTDMIQTTAIVIVCVLLVVAALIFGVNEKGILIADDVPKTYLLSGLMMVNFFLINVAFPVVDMSAWQRLIAADSTESARDGVGTAVVFFLITWGAILFASLALSEHSSLGADGGLSTVLSLMGTSGYLGVIGAAVGLFALVGAMLSTADTFLIASGQTIVMDITDPDFFESRNIVKRDNKGQEATSTLDMDHDELRILSKVRRMMAYSVVVGVVLCVLLVMIGFQVNDLVFAVYGSSLSLFPSVVLALYSDKKTLRSISGYAKWSIISGITSGWIYGILAVAKAKSTVISKIINTIDILPGSPTAYNAPTVAIGIASLVMLFGYYRNS